MTHPDPTPVSYDAILLFSFGGPEGPDDVIPFLENVTRGRGIPRERLAVVGEHYGLFGGISPINAQNRDLIAVLEPALAAAQVDLPIYFGNRNWHPMLADTVEEMRHNGHRRVLALVTSAFGSYSGCRQYREDLHQAAADVDDVIHFDKSAQYWNHPGFLDAMIQRTMDAVAQVDGPLRLVFTAHSVPTAWMATSPYLGQLRAASAHVAAGVADRAKRPELADGWDLVFQSRSGPPQVPWLEPDINDHLRTIADEGGETSAVLVPIGFVSDHMEVVYDLDTEAMATAAEIGMTVVRAGTAGTHPAFVEALVDVVQAALEGRAPATAIAEPGRLPCSPGCCDRPAPRRPPPA